MNRYQTSNGKMWWEIYDGRLIEAYSLQQANKLKAMGAEGAAKNDVRTWYGPLKPL